MRYHKQFVYCFFTSGFRRTRPCDSPVEGPWSARICLVGSHVYGGSPCVPVHRTGDTSLFETCLHTAVTRFFSPQFRIKLAQGVSNGIQKLHSRDCQRYAKPCLTGRSLDEVGHGVTIFRKLDEREHCKKTSSLERELKPQRAS